MSEIEQKKKLHSEVMALWQKYQNLQKEILSTEGRIADLRSELSQTGQKIYELYKISSNGLDGELQNSSKLKT